MKPFLATLLFSVIGVVSTYSQTVVGDSLHIDNPNGGNLNSILKKYKSANIRKVSVSGCVNKKDIDELSVFPNLQVLDLSDTYFEGGEILHFRKPPKNRFAVFSFPHSSSEQYFVDLKSLILFQYAKKGSKEYGVVEVNLFIDHLDYLSFSANIGVGKSGAKVVNVEPAPQRFDGLLEDYVVKKASLRNRLFAEVMFTPGDRISCATQLDANVFINTITDKISNLGEYNRDIVINLVKQSAQNGNVTSMYYLALIYDNSRNKAEAKAWYEIAAQKGNQKAMSKVDEINKAEEAARLAAIELAKLEEERLRKQKEEEIRLATEREARRKRLDSISAITGVPAYYTSLKYQCTVIPRHSDDWRGNEQTIREFQALCTNDLFKYYGKENLSGLDKTLYMKSEEYQRDKRAFEEKRKSNFLLSIRLGWEPYGWTGPDTKPYFEGNGFGFYTTISNSRDIPSVKKNHVMFEDNGIPVKNCVVESGGFGQKLFFGCNDLEKLQYIRDNYSNIDVVFVFKPSFSKNLPYELTYHLDKNGTPFFIGSTLGIYVYNVETDELILDLSKYGRNIDSQAEKQKENGFFNSDKAKIMAKVPKKHSTPKRERCSLCFGMGYIDRTTNGVKHRDRCALCYGKGYTMEYYY